MEGDAERAGRQAGENLGDGIVRGADGRLRDMRGRFVTAGREAGEGLGDGLSDTGNAGADEAVSGMGEKLGALKMAAAGVGAAAGALLMQAFGEAMDQSRIVGRLGAQLGATPAEAKKYGELAGRLYSNAVTEDFQTAADAISAIMRAGIAPPGATEAQLESIATKVSDLASTFELDLGQTANAVGQMIKTGLAKDGTEALDALTAGLQKMGPRADDIADTFNEYSTIFRQMGLDASTATGLLSQGMKAGARDTDVVADALKEFVLITQGGGKEVEAAFAAIGMSGKDMQEVISEGGPPAEAALDMMFDRLRKIEDPAKRAEVALALFGTKAEDTQKALFALDPSEATAALGDVGGAAEEMGDTLRDNAGTRLEQFKRKMQQNLVDFLGGTVVPAFTNVRDVAGKALGGMWAQAGKEADSAAFADRIVAFFPILGQRLAAKARELAPKMIEGIAGAGQSVAEWIMQNPTKVLKVAAIAGAITLALVALPALAAAAISVAAISLMVGFVGRLITALIENVPRWWASFTGWITAKAGQAGAVMSVLGAAIGRWFSGLWSRYVSGPVGSAWASFIASVQALPGRASGALSGLGSAIRARAVGAWQSFRDSTVNRALGVVSWVRGLPRRIAGAFGNVAGLLYGKGQDVVRGLLNGVRSMGGYLRSQLMSFARSMIPGPIAKALGIASPSKVMAKSVGRWIPRGIVAGIESSSGELDRTMAGLVNTPTPSASYAGAVGSAMNASGSGGGSVRTATLRAGDALTDQLLTIIRNQVGIAGGDVQVVLGNNRR
ncbi:hypothetical protein B1H29_31645 [Streptomyces pactum]|uniref:Phage tail tape measure protein domain-containing protein n=3 Tax=Streptomyces pactum TaxID=68249 RepID=A0A1S6JKQ1_9ACTN|nr:hypothetical protein B1H29_31645 [Streptomyces pactum]